MSLFKSGPAWSKGADESASRTGQYCHDQLPRTFDCVDLDAVIYKRSGSLMRILEEKLPGESISLAQSNVLPKFAMLIELGIRGKQLRDDSGVFIVWYHSPMSRVCDAGDDETVTVQKVPCNKYDLSCMPSFTTTVSELRGFLSGEYWKMPITPEAEEQF
jgi:hypothetical protein